MRGLSDENKVVLLPHMVSKRCGGVNFIKIWQFLFLLHTNALLIAQHLK